MPKQKVVDEIWDDFTEHTTIDAIAHIFEVKSLVAKFFWFCTLLILTAFSGYQVVICVQRYYKYPVTVTTQVSFS